MNGNQNPRIGVLLRQYGASVRLFNVLNPQFGKWGLKRFQKAWPEAKARQKILGMGPGTWREWEGLLEARDRKRKALAESVAWAERQWRLFYSQAAPEAGAGKAAEDSRTPKPAAPEGEKKI